MPGNVLAILAAAAGGGTLGAIRFFWAFAVARDRVRTRRAGTMAGTFVLSGAAVEFALLLAARGPRDPALAFGIGFVLALVVNVVASSPDASQVRGARFDENEVGGP